MDATKLIAYLPFDTSTTEDKCGNTWTTSGTPVIEDGALKLDGSSYLQRAEQFEFTGQPFTVSCKFSATSNTTGGDVCLWQMYIGNSNRIQLEIATSGRLDLWKDRDSTIYIQTAASVLDGQIHHVECDFDGATWYLFLDGVLIGTKAHTCTARDYSLYVGTNYQTDRKFTGTIDEFMIFDGVALHTENFTPPTDADYAALKVALGSKVAQFLSFTGNAGCYAELPLDVLAGATTFTIEAKFSTTSTKNTSNNWTWGTIAGREIGNHWQDDFGLCVNNGKLCFWAEPKAKNSLTSGTGGVFSNAVVNDGAIHKVAVVSSDGAIDLYCDGVNVAHADNVNAKITDAQTILIAYDSDSNSYLQMELYELRFWNEARTEIFADIDGTEAGLQGWYLPSADGLLDYSGNERHATLYGSPVYTELTELPLTVTFDLERKVKNAALTWRYENPGYADDLLVGSWTQGALPESQSRTGIAFVNEYRQKCFDLPATNEVWMKFDVYFDGSNRWRAYNDNSYGTTGITAQTDGRLGFFANDNNQGHFDGVCIANQLQTVLLHMVSGSSAGVIEAWVDDTLIYRYTGDVNHGEDFADLYLQSDGGNTFFSNVIISNAPIDFAEGWQIFHYDVDRRIDKTLELDFDLERRVKNVVDFELAADLELKFFLPVTLTADLRRNVIRALEFDADVELLDVIPTEFTADLELKRPIKIKLYPTETAQYFSGDGVTPVTIPTQKVIPPAHDDEASLQSIELVIAEQQITDQVKATGIIPFEIMSVAEGEVLDYVCDMRVERVTQRGILYTCDCCSDIDALLFTQMNYTLPASTTWHKAGEDDTTQEIETHYPPATEHVNKIANALGLTPIMQFDNFLSTVLMDDLGGVTYNDLIRDVFGWSSRVPTMMINVYIRNGKLFVIQRGHEANVIDISDADKSLPTYTRELVRTTWGSTPWSKTETREQTTRQYVPPDRTVSGGSSSGDDDNDETVREVSTQFFGSDTQGHTTYTYNREGLLVQTYTYVRKHSTRQNTYTTVHHGYDDDGTMISTESFTQSMGDEGDSASRSVNEKHYVILPNGEKFLASEYSAQYQNNEGISITDSNLVDSKYTVHSPSRVGQSHTITINGDGDIDGEVTGQNTGDDRVTPFATSKAQSLAQAFKGNYEETTDTESRTVNGLSLYDSSFPIHDEATLIKITNELRRLNRKTRETVTLSVYGLPHVVDFNDRIILDGNEYFLVSNRLTITARLYNEQTLTLTRWY